MNDFKNKKFGFVLFEQFEDLDFAGPWEIMGLWQAKFNGPELFVISEHGGTVKSTKSLGIADTVAFKDSPILDYLLVPGGEGTRSEVNNPALIEFVKQKSRQCSQVLSVCTGAFILQKAGLLAGKTATTHWASLDRLKLFTEINVVSARYTHDGSIWTSAGVSAGIDMALAFLDELAGRNVAGKVQLFAEYFPDNKIYSSGETIPEYLR